jgi:K+-transporting ATPase A subunit
MMFLVTDWVVGDIRRSFWPLISMVAYAHSAPESAMGGLIYNTAYGNLAIVVAMVFATRLAPILGALFYGRRMVLPKSAVRSTPGEGMAL